MRIKLNSRQVEVFNKPFWKDKPLDGVSLDDDGIFTCSVESIELVRDSLTELLASIGFDCEYALTEEGRVIEELIDLFHCG